MGVACRVEDFHDILTICGTDLDPRLFPEREVIGTLTLGRVDTGSSIRQIVGFLYEGVDNPARIPGEDRVPVGGGFETFYMREDGVDQRVSTVRRFFAPEVDEKSPEFIQALNTFLESLNS